MFRKWRAKRVIGLFILSGLAGLAACQPSSSNGASMAQAPEASSRAPALAALEQTLEQVYTSVKPSVVNIRIVQKQEIVSPSFPEIPGFPFFGLPFPQGPQEQYRRGLGSGFVWDKQGHIVTNNHVVAGANRISVTFSDGTTVPGKVVGADPDSDLAVVKVDVNDKLLTPVTVGDSTRLKVGQLTVAIGNPFGLQSTMTVGFISGLGRLLPADSADTQGPSYSIPDIIQTDAPINPGNSGGVLLDDQGRVIGVTAAILSPVGASIGIGFAIPSAIVQKAVPALIKTGHYEHPWLGVSGTSLTPDLARAMNLKADQRGALVIDVVPGSPADKAGLRGSDRQVEVEGTQVRVGGDIVLAIDRHPVKSFDDVVTYLIRNTKVGQAVELSLLRDGNETTVAVTLAARPKSGAQRETTEGRAGTAWLGISGVTVTPEIAKAIALPENQKGVLIQQVEQNSPADKAGLRGSYKPTVVAGRLVLIGGDVIVAFNGKPVHGIEELRLSVQAVQPGKQVRLTLLRDRKQIGLMVTLQRQATVRQPRTR